MTTMQRMIKYCAMAFAVFLSISILSGILGALGMLFGVFGGDAAGERKSYKVSGEIESLDVEISAAELKIVTGDCFSVESNHKYLTVMEEKGVLIVSEKRSNFGVSSGDVAVVMTIPEKYVFEGALISAGAGKVSIDTLSAKELTLELGAGATEIGTLEVKNHSSVSSGTGKLTIRDGELHDLSMEMGVGKLEFTGRMTGNCDVDFGIGGAELTLLGSRDEYQIELDKGIGEVTLNGKDMSDGGVYGTGENRIDIDGGVGSIRIQLESNLGSAE